MTTKEATMERAVAICADGQAQSLAELADFVAIKSVSALPEHRQDVAAAADHLAAKLVAMGFTGVQVIPTAGHPTVIGELLRAPESAPTVLVYGHFDVQPVEPLDEWRTDPWTMTEVDGRVYGRGTGDDKGQLWMHLDAIAALLAAGDGTLPVNVRILAEGEEEVGSPNMSAFLEEYRDRLAADVAVVSDTPTHLEGWPAIGYSLRGLCSLEVELTTLRTDLHSGQFGGAVPNAARAMAALIGTFHDDDGRVAVPGFYDTLTPVSEQELGRLRALPFDEKAWLDKAGAAEVVGEKGFGALELTWNRPTLEVNGMYSGHLGAGTKTIVPGRAVCKVSSRLVSGMDPERTLQLIEQHVREQAPSWAQVRITRTGGAGNPYHTTPSGPVFDLACQALAESFGREVHLVRDGGAIPVVPLMAAQLALPVLLLGFGCPDEAKHAPNEWLSLHHFRAGREALIRFYHRLGTTGGLLENSEN